MNKIVALQEGFSQNLWCSSEIANRNAGGKLMNLVITLSRSKLTVREECRDAAVPSPHVVNKGKIC
jgi:hypothetical protein